MGSQPHVTSRPSQLEQYVAAYENANRSLAAGEPAWLAHARQEALDRFLSAGFPTTRDEEWRFTSVSPIAEQSFARSAVPGNVSRLDVDPYRMPGSLESELVFVGGHFIPALSRMGGYSSPLANRAAGIDQALTRLARPEANAFVALNTALLTDGAFVHVPARTVVPGPIHLLFLSTEDDGEQPAMSHPRVLIVMDEQSQASIVTTFAGAGGRYFTNAVTEIVLGPQAVLDHYNVQRESASGYHVASIHMRAERGSSVTSHSLSLGGSLVRNDVVAVLDGEGAECTLNGLYLADEQRLVDNHTTIDHAKPHCGSREIYKGILADRARGVFNGKIVVRPDAQKTDAKQTNRALLLSENAQINTKPQLEIFANDVKCTHGAAVGQLDDEAVFYLRSRGLSHAQARHLLVRAFASDVLSRMALEPLRARVEDALLRQLARVLPEAA